MTPGRPKKRRGRHALDAGDPSTGVCIKLPSKLYDAAYRVATREQISVPEVMRRALKRLLAACI